MTRSGWQECQGARASEKRFTECRATSHLPLRLGGKSGLGGSIAGHCLLASGCVSHGDTKARALERRESAGLLGQQAVTRQRSSHFGGRDSTGREPPRPAGDNTLRRVPATRLLAAHEYRAFVLRCATRDLRSPDCSGGDVSGG